MRAVGFDQLGDDELEAWRGLAASDRAFDSPFFQPGFSVAVHESGHRVTVVLGTGRTGDVKMVWPLHVDGSVLRPVGWPGADFQGPVGATPADPAQVLRAAGARTLIFDHLAGANQGLLPHVETWRPSPYVEVAGGLDGYLARASKSGRSNMGQARRRVKKAIELYGELRFTSDSTSSELLDQVIALKRHQYAATGSRDYFARPERVALLHRLLADRDPAFAGVLSAVHCGDTLVAAHFGIRAGRVLHWWFPVYEPEASSLAPGWILLRELTMAADRMAVDRIDLGRGNDEYKRRAMTGEVSVGEGSVSLSPWARAARSGGRRLRSWVTRTGLAPKVRRLVRGRERN